MDVGVHDRLARRFAIIDADVECVSVQIMPQLGPHLSDELPKCGLFFFGEVKKAGDMPLGDDQGVAFRDRKSVGDGERRIVFDVDAAGGRVAKWAFLVGHATI